MFNDDKTEFMILCSRCSDPATFPILHIGDECVPVSNTACYIGFTIDSGMSFVQQVNSTVKSFSELSP